MAYEPKPGQFSLFRNDKGDNESRPDYTGNGMALDGTPIRVAAWLRDGRNGKFLSCKITENDRGERSADRPAADPVGEAADMDSDIPFDQPYRMLWRSV